MRYILTMIFITLSAVAGQFDKVKITPEMASIYVYHKGKAVKVHRIQDTTHKITGRYARLYRPSSTIQPIKMFDKVRTIGEIELVEFMRDKVNSKSGIIVDVRKKSAYESGAIPSAVNIAEQYNADGGKMKKVVELFGLKRTPNGAIDSKDAIEIVVYCHGMWCRQSRIFVKTIMDLGYPAEKILYYRGGIQMWKLLGLTTVATN